MVIFNTFLLSTTVSKDEEPKRRSFFFFFFFLKLLRYTQRDANTYVHTTWYVWV